MSGDNADGSHVWKKLVAHAQEKLHHYGGKHYRIEKVVGRGSYGVVYQAYDSFHERKVAIKHVCPDVFKDTFLTQRIYREICMLFHFRQHPNIMGVVDVMKPASRDFDTLFIVMDLMECDLRTLMHSGQPLTEQHVKFFIYQVLCGLMYIHKAGVIHRDITPSNILVDPNCDVRICDFGLARVGKQQEMTDYVCMRWYRAPELVMEETQYNAQVDVWSCGCILAELLSDAYRPLFPGETRIKQLGTILEVIGTPAEEDLCQVGSPLAQNYIRKYYSQFAPQDLRKRLKWWTNESCANTESSSNSKLFGSNPIPLTDVSLDLLQHMLIFNPKKRFSVADCMRHPFFTDLYNVEDEAISVEPLRMNFSLNPVSKDELPGVKNLISEKVAEIRSLLGDHPDIGEESMGAVGGILRNAPESPCSHSYTSVSFASVASAASIKLSEKCPTTSVPTALSLPSKSDDRDDVVGLTNLMYKASVNDSASEEQWPAK